jgi:signal transduction histidine kinase
VETVAREVVGLWDPVRVERVVSNLLSNAVKYSPEGGDVLVSVCDEVDWRDRRRWAALRVRDSGIGISAQDLPRVFEGLYRGRNVIGGVPGTGLGLAAVRRMVAEHGGTISVESEEGHGSAFTVRLPLDTEQAGTDARAD